MATLKELRDVRIQKLQKLKELGVDPYPAESKRTHTVVAVTGGFEKLENTEVTVVGRVTSVRDHKNLKFMDIRDSTDQIQFYIKDETLGDSPNHKNSEIGFSEIELLDEGDFVEGTGKVVKTRTGQVSVELTSLRLLTKSLRPMPDKHYGLENKETRLRRRYLDTNINRDVYERFIRRARFWEAHREFFKKHNFLEMNIPVLEAIPGGADANPFVTHMDAIDEDFYLRISQELYLKRLIGGGYERVYEVGPRFRNEGISDEHLPEHMAMEFYWAYASFEDGIEFVIDMFRFVADYVYKNQKFNIRGFEVDLSKDWERINYVDTIKEHYGIDIFDTSLEEVTSALKRAKIPVAEGMNLNRGIDALWKGIRGKIGGPAIVVGEPKFLSPLAKSDISNPELTQRMHPLIGGSELGNGFAELNDPIDQLERFQEQQNLRDSGDAEAQFLDIDYVEMLEYGMPPTFGYGHSERNFWFFENVSAREGVPFPQLKHEIDQVTKEIYGL